MSAECGVWEDFTALKLTEFEAALLECETGSGSPPIDEGYGGNGSTEQLASLSSQGPTSPRSDVSCHSIPADWITKDELQSRVTEFLAVNPMGPEEFPKNIDAQFKQLEAAFEHPPRPGDSQRRNTFVPGHLFPIPRSWPQRPAIPTINSMKFYANREVDTLFFMFYFYEGTVAQITAAQALRGLDWRYHKKWRVWMQRLEVPKVTTYEYEKGSYRYWDPFSWSEKRRECLLELCDLDNENLNRWPQMRA